LENIMTRRLHVEKFHASARGFTMMELMAGMAMTLIVGGLALQAITATQKDFAADQENIENGQKLSSVLDVIGRDVKQAGEEISEANFPVVQVISDGTKGSRLVLYRALVAPLPLCAAIPASTATTSVAVSSNVPAITTVNLTCQSEAPPTTSSTMSDCDPFSLKLRDWCEKRRSNGSTASLPAVIHDQSGNLYSFSYNSENTDYNSSTKLTNNAINLVANPSFTPSAAIPVGSTVYLVEKREYLICDNELKVWINSNSSGCPNAGYVDASYQTIATGVEKMDITTTLRTPVTPTTAAPDPVDLVSDTSVNSNFPTTISSVTYTWQNIQGLKISIRSLVDPARVASINNDSTLSASTKLGAIEALKTKATVESKFYPRNILSARKKS
jgi:Tfp pilus assembly protein PilW